MSNYIFGLLAHTGWRKVRISVSDVGWEQGAGIDYWYCGPGNRYIGNRCPIPVGHQRLSSEGGPEKPDGGSV